MATLPLFLLSLTLPSLDTEAPEYQTKAQIKEKLEDIAFKRWKFSSLDDWYPRKAVEVLRLSPTILGRYEGSLFRALSDLYPEHKFKFWKFNDSPLRLWRLRKNQREFFEDLLSSRASTSFEALYDLSRNDVADHGGQGLLEVFGNSVSAAIMAAYPEHKWQIFRFEIVPKNFWNSEKNVTDYLSWLRAKLGLSSMDDWYKVTRRDFVQNRGGKLLSMSKDSVSVLLKKHYPGHAWDDSKFQNIPLVFENDEVNKKEFLRAIEDKFQIKGPEEWYRISMQQLHESGGKFALPNRPTLLIVL